MAKVAVMAKSELKIFAVVAGLHWGPLLLAARLWPLRELRMSFGSAVTLAFSFLAWLIVAACLLVFSDIRADGRAMTGIGAYLIYSMMTLGVLPVLIVAVHIFAGRSAGLWVRNALDRRFRHSAAME